MKKWILYCLYYVLICGHIIFYINEIHSHSCDIWMLFSSCVHVYVVELLSCGCACWIRSWVRRPRDQTWDVSPHTLSPSCHSFWPRYTAKVHLTWVKTVKCWRSIKLAATLNFALKTPEYNFHYKVCTLIQHQEWRWRIYVQYFIFNICVSFINELSLFFSPAHWLAVLGRRSEGEPPSQSSPLLWPADVQQLSEAGEGRSVTNIMMNKISSENTSCFQLKPYLCPKASPHTHFNMLIF